MSIAWRLKANKWIHNFDNSSLHLLIAIQFQRNFCITDGKIILMSHEKIMEFSRIKQI
jgi:hypothetical protein